MYNKEDRITWLNRESGKHGDMAKWILEKLGLGVQIFKLEEIENLKKTSAKKLIAGTDAKEIEHRNKHILQTIDEDLKFKLNSLDEKEFKRIKSRWSSHVNRKTNRNISCSVAPEIYKKLTKIKGKHQLKETLEAIISLAYKLQTSESILDMKNPKTTPILESYPTAASINMKITPENTDTITNIQHTINAMQDTIFQQNKFISDLMNRLNTLEKNGHSRNGPQ